MAATLDHLAQLLNATLDAQHHRKGKLQCLNPQTNRQQPRHAAVPEALRLRAGAGILALAHESCTSGHLTNTHMFGTAEAALKEEAKKPNYSLSLLSIVSTAAQPLKTRLAAALAFKNFIRHNYVVRTISRFFETTLGG